MKKNAVALAVGALFIAPAAQAQIVFGNDAIGTMQIYGKLYPEVKSSSSSGPTQPGATVSKLASPTGVCGTTSATGSCTGLTPGHRLSVDVQNSYLGFRGERRLGKTGLKGFWQIEQALDFDDGDTATFSNRNSFLGLGGGFGEVKLGHMDTIYKEYGAVVSMFGIGSGNFVSPSNMLSQIGVGRNSAARFHERAKNTIQYQTPELSGFQAGLQYSPDEAKEDTTPPINKRLWSMGVKYEKGPLYLSVQHEIHKDYFGGSNNVPTALRNNTTTGASSTDKGTRFSATYKLGAHKVAFDISRLKWSESGQTPGVAKFDSYEHTTWDIGWEAKWGGPFRTYLEYVRAAEGTCKLTVGDCSTTGIKGDMLAGGLAYDLDKQTFLFLIAAKLNNGDSAMYDNWSNANPARGADITQVAAGMSYKF